MVEVHIQRVYSFN